uniref:Uncharacterized protein LOC111118564 isoform X2 n=1 Tax=Crassostrea virginica TaxID=6565 RepID=A0A8B8CDQ5_CRAVI|nr:uncharacterized protein LOC111118564 isoform X2 [Crassostrea virginica]
MYWPTLISLAMMRMVNNVEGIQYVFYNQSETWEKARDVCRKNDLKLASFNETSIESKLQNCSLEGVTDLWTDIFMYTTPYMSLVGCFLRNDLPTQTIKADSLIECQIFCEEHPRFAIMKTECVCLKTGSNLGKPLNNAWCNFTCDGVRCGGDEAVSVYEIVKGGSVVGEQKFTPNVSLSCLVYQCANNSINYEEEDCRENSITLNTDYFSCTFEPEDDCFLVQPTWDDFDWSVQNTSLTNYSGYEPSYYAYVDGTGSNSNQTATLISTNSFKAANWCLRFRYLASLATSLDVTLLDIIQDKNKSLINIRNATNTSKTDPDWYYVEVNIIGENDFKLMFSFEESNESSNIALDDVSMIAGYCNETLTELLNQRGELQCTFGGNTDMCFTQDNMEDTADWVYKNNQAILFRAAKQSSILISAFEFQDVSVHICVRYYTVKEPSLIFYTDQKNNTLPNNIMLTTLCTNKTLSIEVKSKLYINGTLSNSSSSEININHIRITIFPHSQKNATETPQRLQKPVPDPSVLTTSDLSNVRCMSEGPRKYTNTIRLQGKYLSKNGVPSAVVIYRTNDSTLFWEKIEPSTKRHFVCEEDTNDRSEGKQFPIWIVAVVVSGLVVITTVVILTIIWKRKRTGMIDQTTPSVDLKNKANAPYSSIRNKGTETVEDKAEGDYDHLHQQQPPVEMSDNVYSHMADSQYGLLPVMTDDTYDHSVQRDAEYGTTDVSPKPDDTYDHA